jgi:hypothetical protein
MRGNDQMSKDVELARNVEQSCFENIIMSRKEFA